MKTIELYLAKADETMQEAVVMKQNNLYSGSVSRSYYASFYAVQAALESKSVFSKTHQGALIMFNKHFIKTEIFPRTLSAF